MNFMIFPAGFVASWIHGCVLSPFFPSFPHIFHEFSPFFFHSFHKFSPCFPVFFPNFAHLFPMFPRDFLALRPQPGARGHWRLRGARRDPLGAGAAEDAQRQNHAPRAAEVGAAGLPDAGGGWDGDGMGG